MRAFLRQHGLAVAVALGLVALAGWRRANRCGPPNFGVVSAGAVYRAGQPRTGDWRRLAERDVRTVINLRSLLEEADIFIRAADACERIGAEMVNIPLKTPVPTDAQVAQFLQEVRSRDGAVLIHGESGTRGTGIMVAAYRVVVQRWGVRKAWREMRRFGARFDADTAREVRLLLRRLAEQRDRWRQRTHPSRIWI
jgi:protein tyrosine phosphatase (PTP) superfamily phosphohydrolase (DUF442 family)